MGLEEWFNYQLKTFSYLTGLSQSERNIDNPIVMKVHISFQLACD